MFKSRRDFWVTLLCGAALAMLAMYLDPASLKTWVLVVAGLILFWMTFDKNISTLGGKTRLNMPHVALVTGIGLLVFFGFLAINAGQSATIWASDNAEAIVRVFVWSALIIGLVVVVSLLSILISWVAKLFSEEVNVDVPDQDS